MAFEIVISSKAMSDVQNAIDYYDEQQLGLGLHFEKSLNEHLTQLEKNPFFQIRYNNVHCLPMKKYPYMIHYTVNEEDHIVTIHAIFNTSRDPNIWKNRM